MSETLITGAWSMGTAIAYTPNFQKGILSAKKIIQLINRVPLIRNPDFIRELIWVINYVNHVNKIDIT